MQHLGRSRRGPRAHWVRLAVLLGALAALAVVPATSVAKTQRAASPQANDLSVFSWWTGGGEAHGLEALIKIWNKNHPEAPFKNETVAGGAGSNAKAVLAQRLAAHKPPDSFQGHAGAELQDYIKAGQLDPIDSIYKQYKLNKVFPAQLISQIKYKGHLYSVPVNIHRANVLWYNPKVLADAGVTAAPTTWDEFFAAADKIKAKGIIPLALGEQWTAMHLFETILLGTLGADKYNALWAKGGDWNSADVKTAITTYAKVLTYTNTDATSLTWQDASKLVADGKAAMNIMGDWADGYFSGSKEGQNLGLKPDVDYKWAPAPGTKGVFQFLSDSFTLPKGAPHPATAKAWLNLAGSKEGQEAFNPVKGSICARTDCNKDLFNVYLKSAIEDWSKDKIVGSLTHGVVAADPFKAAIDTGLGLFLKDKDTTAFQAALVAAMADKGPK